LDYDIVKAHGGDVKVEEEGERRRVSMEFIIQLPV
jgi:signal transduction histidine kinase